MRGEVDHFWQSQAEIRATQARGQLRLRTQAVRTPEGGFQGARTRLRVDAEGWKARDAIGIKAEFAGHGMLPVNL
jgi:hypothetical protein